MEDERASLLASIPIVFYQLHNRDLKKKINSLRKYGLKDKSAINNELAAALFFTVDVSVTEADLGESYEALFSESLRAGLRQQGFDVERFQTRALEYAEALFSNDVETVKQMKVGNVFATALGKQDVASICILGFTNISSNFKHLTNPFIDFLQETKRQMEELDK